MDTDELIMSSSLLRARAICRFIRTVCIIAAALFGIFWIWLLATITLDLHDTQNIIQLLGSCVVLGLTIEAILVVLVFFFGDALESGTLFTRRQSIRLIVLSCLILIFTITEMLVPDFQIATNNNNVQYGFVSDNGSVAHTINMGSVFFSLFVFSLSFFFRYGYLLQDLTDDIV